MTTGLLLTSLALGLRHGIDWDHVAAIADLTGTTDDRRRGFRLSLYYALGHAVVVFALGTLLILAGATIPQSLDVWMGRVVGATLVGLGMAVLWDLRQNGDSVRLRSRWMFVLEGTFAGLRRVRQHRDRRRISIEHSHDHEHDDDIDHTEAPAHDHAHDGASVPQEVLPGPRRSRWRRHHRHPHDHHLDLPRDRPVTAGGAATGIGMLHGVGIESPTQIAIFVTTTSVVSTAASFALLSAWVVGLVVANAGLAIVAGAGLLRPDGNRRLFQALAVLIATMSIALGLRYIFA